MCLYKRSGYGFVDSFYHSPQSRDFHSFLFMRSRREPSNYASLNFHDM